jgi:hypothetical protein
LSSSVVHSFLVPAPVNVGALEELHQGLPHFHREDARVPGKQRSAVDEGVPRGDRERIRIDWIAEASPATFSVASGLQALRLGDISPDSA